MKSVCPLRNFTQAIILKFSHIFGLQQAILPLFDRWKEFPLHPEKLTDWEEDENIETHLPSVNEDYWEKGVGRNETFLTPSTPFVVFSSGVMPFFSNGIM
ncbi:MAG: hypothetical protein KGZ58_03005 [Ignavibacteriales bacterium]|nr:hypothetical protein [Ignavibacteriales bacterium]